MLKTCNKLLTDSVH